MSRMSGIEPPRHTKVISTKEVEGGPVLVEWGIPFTVPEFNGQAVDLVHPFDS